VIYPKEKKKIFAEMERRGAIISEFAMGTFPGPQNFRSGTVSARIWRSEL
jgi:predicted Rossmann fold nucleotide-binding protein DprA/Smf involved in DNA uptake